MSKFTTPIIDAALNVRRGASKISDLPTAEQPLVKACLKKGEMQMIQRAREQRTAGMSKYRFTSGRVGVRAVST
jgi:hypothetical protein